jgi:hypothetical protein
LESPQLTKTYGDPQKKKKEERKEGTKIGDGGGLVLTRVIVLIIV